MIQKVAWIALIAVSVKAVELDMEQCRSETELKPTVQESCKYTSLAHLDLGHRFNFDWEQKKYQPVLVEIDFQAYGFSADLCMVAKIDMMKGEYFLGSGVYIYNKKYNTGYCSFEHNSTNNDTVGYYRNSYHIAIQNAYDYNRYTLSLDNHGDRKIVIEGLLQIFEEMCTKITTYAPSEEQEKTRENEIKQVATLEPERYCPCLRRIQNIDSLELTNVFTQPRERITVALEIVETHGVVSVELSGSTFIMYLHFQTIEGYDELVTIIGRSKNILGESWPKIVTEDSGKKMMWFDILIRPDTLGVSFDNQHTYTHIPHNQTAMIKQDPALKHKQLKIKVSNNHGDRLRIDNICYDDYRLLLKNND